MKDIDKVIQNHPNRLENYPHMLRAYKEGYLDAEDVLAKLSEIPQHCLTCGQRLWFSELTKEGNK